MVTPNEFDTGMAVYIDDELYIIVDYNHSKRARGGAKVKTTLKNASSGEKVTKTFSPDDNLKQAIMTENPAQYLYNDGQFHVFMDMDNYDQVQLSPDVIGDKADYLRENMELELQYCDGQPIGIELPAHVALEIEETQPGVRGNTAQGGTKPATLETGLQTQVPLFVNESDKIKVKTSNGEYVERVEE
ncbi:MAG: elongation factor P [bacterium]